MAVKSRVKSKVRLYDEVLAIERRAVRARVAGISPPNPYANVHRKLKRGSRNAGRSASE